jgi:hypothetical protein
MVRRFSIKNEEYSGQEEFQQEEENVREPASERKKSPGTCFLCKKPVPEPSGKNSKWLAVD